ncbi:MAG: ribonuclease P protein component [Cyanobacteria bacterium P01_D01_bin.36]
MALPKQNRLRSNRDFGKVHRKGKRAATKYLAIRALKRKSVVVASKSANTLKAPTKAAKTHSQKFSQASKGESANGFPSALLLCVSLNAKGSSDSVEGPKFGISISRKVSKRAVVRNRIKRQLKAIIRHHFMAIDPAWQIVIVVRPPAIECSFDDFLRELEYLLQKLAIAKR